jgi:hypothetical protein
MKKFSDIKKIVAEKTGCTEAQVSEITLCFYNDWLKKILSEFKYPYVLVEHLGLFRFRNKNYEKTLLFVEKELKKYRFNLENTESNANLIELWQSKIVLLEHALEMLKTLKDSIEENIQKNKLEAQQRKLNYTNEK